MLRSQEEVGKPGEQGEHGFQGDKVCSLLLLDSSNISPMTVLSSALGKRYPVVKRGGVLSFLGYRGVARVTRTLRETRISGMGPYLVPSAIDFLHRRTDRC